MARKKTAADEAYNARRRARRAAARLEKQAMNSTGRAREVAKRRAAKLRADIKKSYRNKENTAAERQKALSKLARAVPQRAGAGKNLSGRSVQQSARNRAFARQLDLALNWKPGQPQSSLAKDPEMARAMAITFMHAHTDIRREAADTGNKSKTYDWIMQAHETTDLQTAFMETMREERVTIQSMYREMQGVEGDFDAKYEAVKPYLSFVHQAERYRA